MVLPMAIGRRVLFLYLAFVIFSVADASRESERGPLLRNSDAEDSKVAEGNDIIGENVIDNIVRDFEDGYQEVKEKLREIFAQGVEPQSEEEEEDDFKDYLEPVFDRPESELVEHKPFKSSFTPSKMDKIEGGKSRRRPMLLRDGVMDIADNEVLLGQERSLSVGSRKRANVNHVNRHHSGHEHTKQYLNEWVIHLTGGRDLAASVAKDLGYSFLGQIGDFKDVYRLVKKDHPTPNKRDAPTLTHELNVHAEVKWAEQQFAKERTKRAIVPKMNLIDDKYDPYAPLIREKRTDLEEELERKLEREINEEVTMEIHKLRRRRSAMAAHAQEMEGMFNDEQWVHQWYLFDTRSRNDLPKLDLQVVPVWESGVTGSGVRLLVLDDGLEWTHTDIKANYDAEISYDFNDNDDDPMPRYDSQLSNSHGTRCAGEIAMMPNNRKCGVGVAFGASIGGVRMLDGPVSDAVEGASLGRALDKVDIITCSWGPTDDGKRVEGPGRLAQMAIEEGITQGRGGKGVVYVWAAGNGGSVGDDCNCDGYTSSIYTLSISSASESGHFPWYGERCASTLAAAYSSGAYTDQKIATTDLHDSCTDKFSGTSAAAPLAAGILALALEVNPELTWRDMQHAVVWSSEWAPLGHNSGWHTNAKGLGFNPRFGFGLLSADGLVQSVRNWTLVSEKVICYVEPTSRSSSTLKTGETVLVEFDGAGCEGTENEVRSLEHVQVMTSINYTRRGALSISLTSPSGTRTHLLTERVSDYSKKGFKHWPFMSVHSWGEDPKGLWLLNITDSSPGNESGTIGDLELVLHGTKDVPEHMKQKRSYMIPFEEYTRDIEDESKVDVDLTVERLRSMSWDELIQLFTNRIKSTFSKADIELLLKEKRLEDTLRNVQSKDEEYVSRSIEEPDWRILLDELTSRK